MSVRNGMTPRIVHIVVDEMALCLVGGVISVYLSFLERWTGFSPHLSFNSVYSIIFRGSICSILIYELSS